MAKKKADAKLPEGARSLVRNRRALHEFNIEERIEAGIVLTGSEVKSLREAHASMGDAYAIPRHGELWLIGMQINEYPWANQFNHEPMRDRKLLLHKREIKKLAVKTQQRGYTLVALGVYLNAAGKIKVELGLATGKQLHEKRQSAKEKQAQRDIDQVLKDRR